MSGADFSETFRQEAQELLEQLEMLLLDLEQSPDDRTLVDGAFRALHTIKGSGAMFGFEQVARFTHEFETAFDRVRKGEVAPGHALIAVALSAKDHIRSLIEQPESVDAARGEAILAALAGVVGASSAAAETAPASTHVPTPPAGADAAWHIRFSLARNVLATGTNPFLLLDELRELGPCTVRASGEEVPALADLDAEASYLVWSVDLVTAHPRSAIDDVFMFVVDDMVLAIESKGDAVAPEMERTATPVTPLPVAANDRIAPAVPTTISGGEPAERKGGRRDADAGPGSSIRVQAERLDELMDRVGELVIAQARLSQLAHAGNDVAIKSIAEEIERLANELRGTTMGIRMVPIGSLFGRFRRLVHDLSRDLGKDLELITTGEETELDKTVVERLADPLIHLIRNAIDHGIDDAATRAAAGKPARGCVRLVARHAGAEVLISVSDDGKGMDRARIRAKAEEQGLIGSDAKPSDQELLQFIFHPGFSTAQTITSLSGRGVGMDVVKRTIEGLRGSIDVASTPGQGTELTLRLPLTLAIIDGLLVRVGKGRYVVPLSAVEECVELSPSDDARSKGRSFLNIRGDLVPFMRLREAFNLTTPPDPYQKVVVVSSGDGRVGLVVDQVIGDHQTVIKSLSRLHADIETFSGATILGDGSVALILDIAHLVEMGQVREEALKAS